MKRPYFEVHFKRNKAELLGSHELSLLSRILQET